MDGITSGASRELLCWPAVTINEPARSVRLTTVTASERLGMRISGGLRHLRVVGRLQGDANRDPVPDARRHRAEVFEQVLTAIEPSAAVSGEGRVQFDVDSRDSVTS